jgi:hypothetical protein
MIEKRGERTGAKEQQSNTSKSLIVVVGDWLTQLGQDNVVGGGKSTGVQVRSLISSLIAVIHSLNWGSSPSYLVTSGSTQMPIREFTPEDSFKSLTFFFW